MARTDRRRSSAVRSYFALSIRVFSRGTIFRVFALAVMVGVIGGSLYAARSDTTPAEDVMVCVTDAVGVAIPSAGAAGFPACTATPSTSGSPLITIDRSPTGISVTGADGVSSNQAAAAVDGFLAATIQHDLGVTGNPAQFVTLVGFDAGFNPASMWTLMAVYLFVLLAGAMISTGIGADNSSGALRMVAYNLGIRTTVMVKIAALLALVVGLAVGVLAEYLVVAQFVDTPSFTHVLGAGHLGTLRSLAVVVAALSTIVVFAGFYAAAGLFVTSPDQLAFAQFPVTIVAIFSFALAYHFVDSGHRIPSAILATPLLSGLVARQYGETATTSPSTMLVLSFVSVGLAVAVATVALTIAHRVWLRTGGR